MQKFFLVIFFLLVTWLGPIKLKAQITSNEADYSGTTDFGDLFFIFCADEEGEADGSLLAESNENANFVWEQYDSLSNTFVTYTGAQEDDSLQSSIYNLSDGCYRVTIETKDGNISTDRAWALNNWINITKVEIPDSTSLCDGFWIDVDFNYAPLNVYNTTTGEKATVRTSDKFTTVWYQGDDYVSSLLDAYVSPPIASNSSVKYTLTITDKDFGCTAESSVNYESKVPESDFSADPTEGEAILEVNFTNSSVNYDSSYWCFYKPTYQIEEEAEESDDGTVDSIDFILTDDSPTYSFKLAGEYQVKLVTVKINDTGNCYDTLSGTYIEVDTTLVEIPNFFTPNGDGMNDEFVIRTQSLKSLNIKIYNRWGGVVHSWKYTNIKSSDYTYEHSVWDGRIGNRMASPGVYYYVIRYEGRDVDENDKRGRNVKGTRTGFIHLFRDKN